MFNFHEILQVNEYVIDVFSLLDEIESLSLLIILRSRKVFE